MPYIGGGKNKSLKLQHLSPAAKLAMKSLVLGAAKTNKDAAAISGLHPAYVGMLKNHPLGQAFMQTHEDKVDEKLLETASLMELLGKEAMLRVAGLMRFSEKEEIILRAATDLMDRAPATSKIHKAQVETFSLSGRDAKEIASAMVEAAKERQKYIEAASGDFVRIAGQEGGVDGEE